MLPQTARPVRPAGLLGEEPELWVEPPAAREAVELVDPAAKTRIVDASSAHRVADGWTYGFPELIGRERIADAARVSNPGCYPTGFLALVAPLVRAGLLPADWPFTVNAVSGYSGCAGCSEGAVARYECYWIWRSYARGEGGDDASITYAGKYYDEPRYETNDDESARRYDAAYDEPAGRNAAAIRAAATDTWAWAASYDQSRKF